MSHPIRRLDVMPHRLSKSRYTAGVQCHKYLWWKVHEPLAVELQPDKVLQDRFDQGAHVGTLARDRFPGGVPIDLPHRAVDERVNLTRKLIDDGVPAIFDESGSRTDERAAEIVGGLSAGVRSAEARGFGAVPA